MVDVYAYQDIFGAAELKATGPGFRRLIRCTKVSYRLPGLEKGA